VIFKKLFALVAHFCFLWPLIYRLLGWVQGKPVLIVFTFHRVISSEGNEKFLQGFERGITLSEFEQQIEHILKFFHVIDLETFYSLADGNSQPNGNHPMALLTFDDADSGHKEIFARLARRRIPGVSFVPTGFIDSDRRFYHLRLTNICNHLSDDQWQEIMVSDIPQQVRSALDQFDPHFVQSVQDVRKCLIAPFHEMKPPLRDGLLSEWERNADITYDLGIGCMSWADINRLPGQWIALGSHTVNHNRLTLLDRSTALADLRESRLILEKETGKTVTSICYPEGSYDKETPALCREAGYVFGFTTKEGSVDYPLKGDDRFFIPRMSIVSGPSYWRAYLFGAVSIKALLRSLKAKFNDSGAGKGAYE